MLNIGRVRWALRKLSLPVSGDALVLDVGSGGKPYPRSDVLLDRLTGAEHRQGSDMLIDRPTVFGDACRMPFKDKAFDYIVASHILEHISDPVRFLDELQRVGKAGYIETPNFIYERLKPFNIHCLEVAEVSGVLHIHKKARPIEDSFIAGLDFFRNNPDWARIFFESPDLFHVRYFWSDKISYVLHNQDTSAGWIEDINANSGTGGGKDTYVSDGLNWRAAGLAVLAAVNGAGRRRRLSRVDISSLLACPECRGSMVVDGECFVCGSCASRYSRLPYPDFTKKADQGIRLEGIGSN